MRTDGSDLPPPATGRDEPAGAPSPALPAPDPGRVAILSLHTSPLDQPGIGDSGGMNVYILSVARRLAEQGIAVDIFTRCAGRGVPDVEEIPGGTKVIQVPAGPCAPVPKEELPTLLPALLGGVLQHAAGDASHGHAPYDVVHSHYWLSGWVGSRAKRIWGVPHVASFHTLGKVKNEALPEGQSPEPAVRVNGERRLVRGADRILAPTPVEAEDLIDLYGADPERIRVVPPGVDGGIFHPRPKDQARGVLGLGDRPVVLFVGRLQAFKGPDLAILAFARAMAMAPEIGARATLLVVGGPAGPDVAVEQLGALAASSGIEDRVRFFPPQPHDRLAEFYAASDVLVVPSHSESFGLVALEAQACGTPVVASSSGGLRYAVVEGETGFLVSGRRPEDYAARILAILGDPVLAASLSAAAVRHAGRFSWESTAQDVRRVYAEAALGRLPQAGR
jgi:D-inositol-3-phosphate glycosyltransferase